MTTFFIMVMQFFYVTVVFPFVLVGFLLGAALEGIQLGALLWLALLVRSGMIRLREKKRESEE